LWKKTSREIEKSKFKKRERKEFYTEDSESTEDTEKIEAEKSKVEREKARRERRAEDQSRE
jgi:hypothetical protein